jgi:hypothetical protein
MAMHIVTTCTTDDDSRNLEDVRRLKLSLDRERVFFGETFWKFSVISDYPKKDIRNVLGDATRIIEVEREDENDVFHDPSFYLSYAFDNYHFSVEDKVVYLDANVVVKNLCMSLFYDGLPDRGDCSHSNIDTLTQEQRERIEAENLPAFYQCEDWTGKGDTKYLPYFLMFTYGQQTEFNKIIQDEEKIKQYPTFQHLIEAEFNGEIIRTVAGKVGPYRVNDADYNDELISAYEKNVRPYFPGEFSAMGGEEDERYISIDHEYRNFCKQTVLIHLERPDNCDPFEDRYLELWLL